MSIVNDEANNAALQEKRALLERFLVEIGYDPVRPDIEPVYQEKPIHRGTLLCAAREYLHQLREERIIDSSQMYRPETLFPNLFIIQMMGLTNASGSMQVDEGALERSLKIFDEHRILIRACKGLKETHGPGSQEKKGKYALGASNQWIRINNPKLNQQLEKYTALTHSCCPECFDQYLKE